MIELLPRPSICLIDDEEQDYEPMKKALLLRGVVCAHLKGASIDDLPPAPISGFRVILLDLYLTSASADTALAHTTNVFIKSVSIDDGPLVVVIWSKHANETVPSGDETESDKFKARLKDALGPKFEQLIFLVLPKPPQSERPEEATWVEELSGQLNDRLTNSGGVGLLWSWECIAQNAISCASQSISGLAFNMCKSDQGKYNVSLELLMRLLAKKQGGPDCSEQTAVKHLSTTLAGLVQDNLENGAIPGPVNQHGVWLNKTLSTDERKLIDTTTLNGMLLTAAPDSVQHRFAPGMLYDITDFDKLKSQTGFDLDKLKEDCFMGKLPAQAESFKPFKEGTSCVAVEITPACDFHQSNRRIATLVIGLRSVTEDLFKKAQDRDSCKGLRVLEDRFSSPKQKMWFVFCATYRITVPLDQDTPWLKPRLRLRDLVVTDLRNWASAQASRVGYLSV